MMNTCTAEPWLRVSAWVRGTRGNRGAVAGEGEQ